MKMGDCLTSRRSTVDHQPKIFDLQLTGYQGAGGHEAAPQRWVFYRRGALNMGLRHNQNMHRGLRRHVFERYDVLVLVNPLR